MASPDDSGDSVRTITSPLYPHHFGQDSALITQIAQGCMHAVVSALAASERRMPRRRLPGRLGRVK
jgi:hypothetical protein